MILTDATLRKLGYNKTYPAILELPSEELNTVLYDKRVCPQRLINVQLVNGTAGLADLQLGYPCCFKLIWKNNQHNCNSGK